MKRYFQLGEVFSYFIRVFRKRDSNAPDSFNLRMMHGINRVSIVMFLICVIIMIVRALTR
jgi:heme/copper-type cytochrome/quinol oxidase subunit 2